MAAQPNFSNRFIRKTQLAANEYHKNFLKLDEEIIAAITSAEADHVTPLMSKIYLRLVNAPDQYWEREGVLRFEAESRVGKHTKAWAVLCEMLGVASATANKAITWLHDSGIIGYFAGKNGVGLRIFLNRASSSIGVRAASAGPKILRFAPASTVAAHASQNEPAFKDSYAVLDSLDTDINSRAPKNGADTEQADKTSPEPHSVAGKGSGEMSPSGGEAERIETKPVGLLSLNELVQRLRSELEPSLQTAARRAAAREHERTREWLENRGLPKIARVAQREAYNVLRSHGVIQASKEHARAHLEVGRSHDTGEARPLSPEEIKDLAEMCIAMLETHGQTIDVTLSEISAAAGGCLLAEDAPKVRALAESMAHKVNHAEK